MTIASAQFLTLLVCLLLSANSFRNNLTKLPHNSFLLKRLSPLLNNPKEIQHCEFCGTGSILVAKPNNSSSFLLSKSVVLITEHGKRGSVGQILNKPSSWSMEERGFETDEFAANEIYLGGESKKDTAVMIHKYNLGGLAKDIGKGIYLGGMGAAREKVRTFQIHPRDFKFVCSDIQWAPRELEAEIKNGTKWDVCEAPVELLVQQNAPGETALDLWATLRAALKLPA